jgi:hypothetical protein
MKTIIPSAAVITLATATQLGAATLAYEPSQSDLLDQMVAEAAEIQKAQRIIDNGYDMLGDQAPDSAWTINPVKNDVTGATMCAASYKMNLADAAVTDTAGNDLSAEEIDGLTANTRYILVSPAEKGNDVLIRTGYDIADISAEGAVIARTAGLADDAAFASAVPTEITSTSEKRIDEPHTAVDTIAPFPQAEYEACNTKAENGGFDAAFASAAATYRGIGTLEVANDDASELRPTYMSTFIPAAATFSARVSNDGEIESAQACDLATIRGDRMSVSQSLGDVFGGSISGCTRQSERICVETEVENGEATIKHCAVDTPLPVPGKDDGIAGGFGLGTGAGARASAVAISYGGSNISIGDSVFVEGNDYFTEIQEGDDYSFEIDITDIDICSHNNITATYGNAVGCGFIIDKDITVVTDNNPAPIPLPMTAVLLGTALAGLGAAGYRRSLG